MFKSVFLFNLCVVACFTTAIADDSWILYFDNSNVEQLEMGSSTEIKFYAQTNTTWGDEDLKVQLTSSDEGVVFTSRHLFDLPKTKVQSWNFSVNLTSEFLGYAKLYLHVVEMGKLITILLNVSVHV